MCQELLPTLVALIKIESSFVLTPDADMSYNPHRRHDGAKALDIADRLLSNPLMSRMFGGEEQSPAKGSSSRRGGKASNSSSPRRGAGGAADDRAVVESLSPGGKGGGGALPGPNSARREDDEEQWKVGFSVFFLVV